jgi:transposase-like protein
VNGQRDKSKERLWRQRVVEQATSGLSIRAFCQRYGLVEGSFYFWRRELERRKATAPAFAAVTITDQQAFSQEPLEVVLASGVRVRVPSGFDPQTLRQLLAVLEQPAC